MGTQLHLHLVVKNVNVGMMPLFFGHVRHLVDERHGFLKILELKVPLKRLLVEGPFRNLGMVGLGLFFGQRLSSTFTRNAMFFRK